MRFFGPIAWGSEDIERAATPVGEKCFYCPRKFTANDLGAIMPYSGVDGTTEIAVHRSCFMAALSIGEKYDERIVEGSRVELVHGSKAVRGQRGTVIAPKIIPDWTVWIQPDNPDAWLRNGPDVDGFTGVCVEKAHLRKLSLLELIAEAANE